MPDTALTVTSQNVSETFSADTPEKAVSLAVAKYHNYVPPVRIGNPTPVFTGGIAGFFARRSYQVVVQVIPSDSFDELAPDSVDDVTDLLSDTTPAATANAPLVYGRPAVDGLPASAPASAPLAAPAVPQGTFAAALAGMAKSSTVATAVTRATGEPHVAATVPVVDPMSYGGDLRPFDPATGAPLGPPIPLTDLTPVDLGIAPSLRTMLDGVDQDLLDAAFATDVATRGETAAITALFAEHYRAPGLPVLDPGEILVVAGIGAEALTAAHQIAEQVGAAPGAVYASGGPGCAGAVPASRRLRTPADVTTLRTKKHKTPIVVAVDTGWEGPHVDAAAILAALCPVATWAAVDATRRDADTARWLAAHRRLDGLVVNHAEHTSAAAGVLRHDLPVLFLDGRPASPKRWAGILTTGASL